MSAKTRLAKIESADRDASPTASFADGGPNQSGDISPSSQSSEPNRGQPSVLQRRQWLGWTSAAGVAVLAGCRETSVSDESESAPTVRTDVPLRVIWTGTEADADTLRRTWQSISEQPLKITVIAPPSTSATSASSETSGDEPSIWDAAAKADVIAYPLSQLGELVSRDLVMPPLKSDASSNADTEFTVNKADPPAVRVATTYGRELRAKCLGGSLPAMLVGEKATSKVSSSSTITWEAFEQLASEFPGQVAEPTAEGWAGVSYLWRLASVLSATWLFDRNTLEPLLTRPEYVDVLRQMAATVKYGPESPMTPGEIFRNVGSGKLVAGIGFPQNQTERNADDEAAATSNVQVAAFPIVQSDVVDADGEKLERTGRVVFAPQTIVGSLAASCRQTAAASQFLKWLAGGEGSEPLYRSIPGLQHPTSSSSIDDAAGGNYQPWLRSAWQNPNVMPPLNLVGGDRYLAALDSEVRKCLTGGQTPEDACAAISKSWSELHKEYGVTKQKRSWQQALGLL
ncbi:type 2 periplasmic-binding domain-containing protein [Rhodopirellula europaea]|uniref:Extracellular solute-binding protein family 1 n=1 Tax=Rhodopirellula europaea 6C TaxID=1263867 RepID=M2AVU5_9BACT|nr:ABC transporter substrate-binding protein [Rhodopirellula europaea]EMB16827.1 extracellular solute-binding protein family 1 [Rhodopirellula europaea 6C]